ncbi:T6SS immunity protein Tli4 family protein [Achromobacter sp. ESBL13]|uniref:T6SS immunity protein Tli4 family protein n=1 Tax=Achromobacter sp. ESBL13 TaxID=3077328 RepID=UPI002FC76CFD
MKRTITIAAIAIASLIGSSFFLFQDKDPTVTTFSSSKRTWMFGRHLIDLPSDWLYGTGSFVTLYYGLGTDFNTVEVRVLGIDVSPGRYIEAINDRSLQIQQVAHDSGSSMLLAKIDVDPTATLLRFFRNRQQKNYHTHELHLLVGDVYVLIKAHSYKNVMAPVEARIQALAKTITKISDPQTAGPGFGLGPVIIRDHHEQEIGMLNFYAPGTNLELDAATSAIQEQERINMKEQEKQALAGIRYNSLRSGAPPFAGMESEQSGFSYRNGDHHAFLFVVQSYRDNPGFAWPSINMRFQGGGTITKVQSPDYQPDLVRWSLPRFVPDKHEIPLWKRPPSPPRVDATLSDKEAGKLWDAIVASVRLRHAAVAPKPPSAFDQGNPEKAAADQKALDEFLSTDEDGLPWTPPTDDDVPAR